MTPLLADEPAHCCKCAVRFIVAVVDGSAGAKACANLLAPVEGLLPPKQVGIARLAKGAEIAALAPPKSQPPSLVLFPQTGLLDSCHRFGWSRPGAKGQMLLYLEEAFNRLSFPGWVQ